MNGKLTASLSMSVKQKNTFIMRVTISVDSVYPTVCSDLVLLRPYDELNRIIRIKISLLANYFPLVLPHG